LAVAEGGVERSEFEGYTRRHETDRFAHGAMRDYWSEALVVTSTRTENRLTALERWQQRVIGALGLLSLLIVGGGTTVVIELSRR
jgi:hypothetical protein